MTPFQEIRNKCIKPRRKKMTMVDWFMMSTEEVLEIFAKLPSAQKIGTGDEQFVYIPGNRKDRVLLVAHADTTHTKKVDIGYYNGMYLSRDDQVGIGADDRAGCNILWKLKDLGHSLLIPNAEEKGCKGSRFLMQSKEWAEEMAKHQFAMQFDRKNAKNLVMYDVGSDPFTKWLEAEMLGYKKEFGTSTDIKVLLDKTKHKDYISPCGVNVSIGYYNEHTPTEHLKIKEWNSTLSHAYNLLVKNDLPAFKQEIETWRKNSYYNPNNFYNNNYGSHHHNEYSQVSTKPTVIEKESICVLIDKFLRCPACHLIFDEAEIEFGKRICPSCSKEV